VVVGSLPDGAKGIVQAQTASDGTFRVPGLAPGTYGIFVLDSPTLTSAGLSVELTTDQEVAVDLTSGGLKGRIVAAATGAPVAGATVTLEGAAPEPLAVLAPPTATTGEDGSFEIAPVLAGPYRITVSGPGFQPGQATVEVAPHATAWVDLKLEPPAAPP
jgi:hypothetical protein